MLTLPAVQEPEGLNAFPVLYWNHVGLQMNRITHSLGGPHTGPTMSSRALGLLHLSMHDAFFAVLGHDDNSKVNPPYLSDSMRPALPAGVGKNLANANAALTGAAIYTLDKLYRRGGAGISVVANATLTSSLSALIAGFGPRIHVLDPAHRFGEQVAVKILDLLAVKDSDIGADQGRYEPGDSRYSFRDEPVNPVRLNPIDPNDPASALRADRIYHAPFYGEDVQVFAVTDPDGHTLAPPPCYAERGQLVESDIPEYVAALQEVATLGGAPGQAGVTRTADQSVAAYFWAYDGANLIGTPPRLYNQIMRTVAWKEKKANADDMAQTTEFVRLFALINTAMADAGKFAWKEKYRYELWRPLSGIREHDRASGPTGDADGHESIDADADPFWKALGAPETNTHRLSFKPPFPAYPSGHATFGAACFQIARLYYKARDNSAHAAGAADAICFAFVSEELDGISRDLHQPFNAAAPIQDQPGVVRTRIVRRFGSLWDAIFENAFSRIYLGVHWRYDAFDARDALDNGVYRKPEDIGYRHVWTGKRKKGDAVPVGGVPLGLGIANDIFDNNMRSPHVPTTDTSSKTRATREVAPASVDLKSSNTNIR